MSISKIFLPAYINSEGEKKLHYEKAYNDK